jgi:flagellar L-ring protein precursor FlgH
MKSRRVNPAIAVLSLASLLAGCKTYSESMQSTPPLTMVGEGLAVQHTALPMAFARPEPKTFHSLYTGTGENLFRDLRARHVGDVVTVTIDINDKAQFDNTTGRSKQGEVTGKLAGSFGFGGALGSSKGDAAADLDLSGSASSKGEGNIDRSEKLHLSIAAVVTEVLPDGNLIISGSQEVRVNHEVRVLNIAGIVRPLDIASSNSIAYDKIAEARISYGGRGKLSAVQ